MEAGKYTDLSGLPVEAEPCTDLDPYEVRIEYEDGRVIWMTVNDFHQNYKEA